MLGCVPASTMRGRQDAGRAIQGREGLVELGHVPADGRFALDQVDMEARVGDLERRLDAGDAAAHHQRIRVDGDFDLLERFVFSITRSTAPATIALAFPWRRPCRYAPTKPARGWKPARTDTGSSPAFFAGRAEGLLMQVRRAGCHDHARQPQFLDVFFDQFLPRLEHMNL
jgi:hypothetical protein